MLEQNIPEKRNKMCKTVSVNIPMSHFVNDNVKKSLSDIFLKLKVLLTNYCNYWYVV